MSKSEVEILKRALERERKARKLSEKILETKSLELYSLAEHLKRANTQLEGLLNTRSDVMDTSFFNIIDPYVVMDLNFYVIRSNASAREFLGIDPSDAPVKLSTFVHPDYKKYTADSFKVLLQTGVIKNYRSKIYVNGGQTRFVQINASLIYDNHNQPIAAQGIIRDVTQEHEIEELLSEQRKQLDVIVENSPLGIVLLEQGKIIKMNMAVLKALGYCANEMNGMKAEDVTAPEDVEKLKEHMRALEKGTSDNFILNNHFVRKDGYKFLAKTSVNAVRDYKGNMRYQVVIVQDITKEIRAQRQLQESENRLATLIRNMEMSVLVENEERKIVLTNQKFCEMFAISAQPDQMVGADCSMAAEETKNYFKYPEKFVQRISEILKTREKVINDELEMLDGRILERDFIPIINNGQYKGHLWTYRDVTLQKTFKKNLQAEKDKYSGIIANMNLGLLETDDAQLVQLANQSFCQMSGYAKEELLGKKLGDVLRVVATKENRNDTHAYFGELTGTTEIQIYDKKGEKRFWLVSGAPRYNNVQKEIGLIGIYLDITDYKNLQIQQENLFKELQVSHKELEEYAHIVSHDLKSPLRSISALATWLKEDYAQLLDDNGIHQFELMQEKIEGMDKLIGDILKYSSIDKEHDQLTAVDVNKVVSSICDIIFIPENVKIEVEERLPVIHADETKIYQLFQNLIANAVMHIDKKEGIVIVGATDKITHWEFNVKDNGIGIPREYHQKIFKIFQSLDNEKAENSTGIGLSIVKKIVDLYQGDVWLDSEVGVGTTFYFTIKKERL
jgi:PAS domain S-box-containing protein